MFCLNCNNNSNFEIKTEKEIYMVKGEKIVINARVSYCKSCGNQIWNDELDSINILEAYSEYRQKHKILQPKEIREIREKYNLSQTLFSRILGVGDKTITRYENGSIQDVAINNLIELMRTPENFEFLLRKKRDVLKEDEYDKVMQALTALHPKIIYSPSKTQYNYDTHNTTFTIKTDCYWGGRKHG